MIRKIFSKKSTAIFFNQHPEPIQRMLDFDWLCKRETPSIAAIVNPGGAGKHKVFWGTTELLLPVYNTIKAAVKEHPSADIFINFASQRSAFETTSEAMEYKSIRTLVITAEGVRENETRELIRLAKQKNKWLIGPATVGAIKPGEFRVANTGGAIDSLLLAKLYRPGSVGITSVSGGMLLELCNIAALYADGAFEAVAVGGDRFPGTTILDNLLRLEADKGVKMHIILGEIGGNAEYEVAEAIKQKKIRKPVIAWVTGTVAKQFASEVQFGHAKAKSGALEESAQAKNQALAKAGAYVPASFDGLGKLVQKVFQKKIVTQKNYRKPDDDNYRLPPLEYKQALKSGLVRRETSLVSSISDDRGEEPTYNKKPISDYVNKPLGHVINALWFQGRLNKVGETFIEFCLKISADHGPAVVTAHNAITTARAGKDLIDSLVAGLLTIGPRHGGAIDGAARWALEAVNEQKSAREFVEEMKRKNELIMGIGHRIKTAQNPDKRVELLKEFANRNLKSMQYLDFALQVEAETLKKKNTLILNVDGTIAVIFLDILKESGFSFDEIVRVVETGFLNGIFALGRSIGIIGHILDQKRLNQGLYRHPWDDILYL